MTFEHNATARENRPAGESSWIRWNPVLLTVSGAADLLHPRSSGPRLRISAKRSNSISLRRRPARTRRFTSMSSTPKAPRLRIIPETCSSAASVATGPAACD